MTVCYNFSKLGGREAWCRPISFQECSYLYFITIQGILRHLQILSGYVRQQTSKVLLNLYNINSIDWCRCCRSLTIYPIFFPMPRTTINQKTNCCYDALGEDWIKENFKNLRVWCLRKQFLNGSCLFVTRKKLKANKKRMKYYIISVWTSQVFNHSRLFSQRNSIK